MQTLIVRCSSLLLLGTCLLAQAGTTPPAPATPPPPAAGAPKDDVRRAFLEDGRRVVIQNAADRVLAADRAGRTQFMATLRAIAAVAPAPAPTPTPTPATAGSTPPSKPPEHAEEIKQLMADAIGSDPEAQKASLAKLAADKTNGAAALAQLDERGRAILARCVSSFVRKKIETNAIFAGQYLELRDFHPEASDLLLRWAKEAPPNVLNPEQFKTACLRALRDTLTGDEGNDRVRADLREIAKKAQTGRNQDQFLTAVCALQQFGDGELFDQMKEAVLKQAEAGGAEEKMQATNMLAELHYQARRYEDAANYYKQFVALVEALPEQPPGVPTFIYNTACSLALAGKTDEALQYLEKALDASAKSERPLTKVLVDTDHDIDSLRQDARFQALYEKHFGKKPVK